MFLMHSLKILSRLYLRIKQKTIVLSLEIWYIKVELIMNMMNSTRDLSLD